MTTQQTARRAFDNRVSEPLLFSFRRYLDGVGKRPATVTHYTGATAQFLAYADENNLPEVRRMKREHVIQWLAALREHGYAQSTVLNRYLGLQQFFKWLVDEGDMRTSPMSKIPRPQPDETSKDIVTPTEMARVFKALEKAKRWRDCVIVSVLYDTGMRASEIANCPSSKVNLETGLVELSATKNGDIRIVHLSAGVIRYVDRYWRMPRPAPEWLVNGHRGKMSASGVYQAVRTIFEELGFKATIGPHDLRHTSTSHNIGHMTETELMTLYGWKNPKMVRHYARQMLREAAIEAHKRSSPMDRLPR